MPATSSSINILMPKLPKEIEGIGEIALNLWWSWNSKAEKIFERIDPYLWNYSGSNPIFLLKRVSEKRLLQLSKEKSFVRDYTCICSV
ncbi:DUF3417 domain-containing protein [Nitrosophilus labii]|uniref:DUF3417 domain-containing protein n=1 Tax=Nitrosophilus labii TaxID=2706014 RepID=UPI0016574CD6|nr:DUF3417 domain-containing protein [Nitrosophilus labii]